MTKYHKASKKACESLVLGAEHILRLRPQVLESNQSLRDRSVFSKIIKTRLAPKPGDNSKSFVHLVYLRVSDEDTVMSETRFGFSVQLDMWKAQYMADQTAMLDFPSTEDHHVVWIVSVQSRIADDQLRDPVAIFEEDSSSDCRLPDLKTMKTATVGTAIGVVLAAEGKNREGRLVTMSAMYADRVRSGHAGGVHQRRPGQRARRRVRRARPPPAHRLLSRDRAPAPGPGRGVEAAHDQR